MIITWPQMITALGILAGGISGIITWLARRDARRSDACESRVAALELAITLLQDKIGVLQEKYVDRIELLLKKSFESNDGMAKGLDRIADQLDEQRQSFPRLLRDAMIEFKRA